MSKRKFWSMVLLSVVATLMLACAVFFTACGNNETPDGGQNTEQSGENPGDGNEPETTPGGDNHGTDEPQDIAVTSISLDKTSLTLEIGESYTLIATVSPSNATDKSVTWSSTNPSVASVSGGKVTAKSEGATTITATAHNGKTAACTVTVNELAPEIIEVTSVALNKTSLTLEIGASETLMATVLPSNATDKSVTWTSSAQSAATVANGKITAIGSGTATITATAHNGKTATCIVTVNAAVPKITSVEGATIDDTEIYMFVDHTTNSVALLDKVTVSSGRWDLYSDILGQNRIPTKIAAGSNGKLQNGDNKFYIMLENDNGDLVEVYTLTIYRSYAISVIYYNHKNQIIRTDITYTGYEYATKFNCSYDGYTFNAWKENGSVYQPRVLWKNLTLYADVTANLYTISLDVNDGTANKVEQKVTFDTMYSLFVPEREGHTFMGWYVGDIQLTDEDGNSLAVWNYPANQTGTAHWDVNQYTVTLQQNDTSAGNVLGAGEHDYGEMVTISVITHIGYSFLGWYNPNEELITTDTHYTFTMGVAALSYTAKWQVATEMKNFTFTSTAISCSIISIIDKTVANIVVPDYVTDIRKGAFSGCGNLTSITLPFVGGSVSATKASSSTLFGYIFGSNNYTGSTPVEQFYSDSSIFYKYYIPASLKNITITAKNRNLFYGSFYDCDMLASVTIGDNIKRIENSAFYSCVSLTSVYITDISAWCQIFFGNSSANPLYFADYFYLNGELVTDLVIPNSVTGISDYAFYGCKSLTSVTIGNGVTSIGNAAFYNCSGLTSVTIGNGVTSIGRSAFYNCSGLTSIAIPDSVTSIGEYAFRGCSELTGVIFGNGVMSIDEFAFALCNNLTSVTIGNGVISIGNSAFYDCSRLTTIYYNAKAIDAFSSNVFYNAGNRGKGITVIFGDTVEKSPSYLFYISSSPYSPNITSVTIGNSVESIGNYAFFNCTSFTNIIIPDNVTSIGTSAFENCSGLTSVTIGNGVTNIGTSAFENCSGLTSVTIGNGVMNIGTSAFKNCKGLTNITIPDSVVLIGKDTFSGCSSLESIALPFVGGNVLGSSESTSNVFGYIFGTSSYIGGTSISQYLSLNTVNSYYIPASLRSVIITGGNIHYGAFSNCKMLTSVKVGNNVNSIGVRAFYWCTNLTSVTIGNSVEIIREEAFYNCWNLTDITIGNSVKSIGESAYYGCSKLTYIVIPDSVTSIGDDAFYKCRGLTRVTIGNSVESIGNSAFFDCTSLTGIDIPDNVTSVGVSAFENCSVLMSVMIGNGVTDIGPSAFSNCTSLTSIIIPDNVTSIGAFMFENCSALTSVTIGRGVINIEGFAFENCKGLTSIVIPNSVKSIGKGAFSGCSSLTSVMIPDSVTSIDSGAFSGCSSLMSVTIPDSVTSIGSGAFSGCSRIIQTENGIQYVGKWVIGCDTSITSITLRANTIGIVSSAFYNCNTLTSVTIPDSVKSIGAYAFYGCSNLKNVTFENSNGWWYSSDSMATSGTDIPDVIFSSSSNAATALTVNYNDYYWKRSSVD